MAVTSNISATLRTKATGKTSLWGSGSAAFQGMWTSDNLVGQIRFASLPSMVGHDIAKIEIGFTTASIGSGGSKTLYMYKDAHGTVMSGNDGYTGSSFVGASLGTLSGINRGGDTIITLLPSDNGEKGMLFTALAAYFETGGNSIVLYKSSAGKEDYDYLSVTACVIRLTYDVVSVPQVSFERNGVAVSSVPAGGSVKILTNREQQSQYHFTLRYSFPSSNALNPSYLIAENVTDRYDWSLPASITEGRQINVSSIAYDSGGTAIGNTTASLVITSEVGKGAPTISGLSISEANPALAGFGHYLAGKSRLTVSFTATPVSGASVVGASVVVDGKTYAGTSVSTTALQTSGSVDVTVSATGSTGDVATKTETITVEEYSDPSLTRFSVARCDSSGLPTDRGKYVQISAVGTIAEIIPASDIVAQLFYRELGDETWSDAIDLTMDDHSLNIINEVLDLDLSTVVPNYEFRIDFGDTLTVLQQSGNTEIKTLLGEFVQNQYFDLKVPLHLASPLAIAYGGTGANSLSGLGAALGIESGSNYLIVGGVAIIWGENTIYSFSAPRATTVNFATYLPDGKTFAAPPKITAMPEWHSAPSGTAVISAMINSVTDDYATIYVVASVSASLGTVYVPWIAIGTLNS